MVNVMVPLTAELSVAPTVNVDVPAAAGSPVIAPVLDSVSPAGSVPETRDQTYGAVPPAAARETEWNTPTVPGGNGDGVARFKAVVKRNVIVAETDALSVASIVKVTVPAALGVPESEPVRDSSSPGSVPEARDQT